MVGNEDDNANQESLLLDLVRTAIFNVCYIRGVFPDMYFGRKRVAALDMKINKLLPMDTDSRRLISWIEKGVFDSLQKNYLKTLVFCIREKIDGPIIEEYSFSFSYSSECVRMNIHLIGKEKHGGIYDITPNQMKSSARKLVRSLIQSMDMLGTLPDERTILMKLICYDDVTPVDYKPPLFRGWTEEEEAQYVWTKNPLTMDLKTVNMKHLLLTLKVKSVLDPCVDENDDMQHDEKSTRRDSVHDEADITNHESLSLNVKRTRRDSVHDDQPSDSSGEVNNQEGERLAYPFMHCREVVPDSPVEGLRKVVVTILGGQFHWILNLGIKRYPLLGTTVLWTATNTQHLKTNCISWIMKGSWLNKKTVYSVGTASRQVAALGASLTASMIAYGFLMTDVLRLVRTEEKSMTTAVTEPPPDKRQRGFDLLLKVMFKGVGMKTLHKIIQKEEAMKTQIPKTHPPKLLPTILHRLGVGETRLPNRDYERMLRYQFQASRDRV